MKWDITDVRRKIIKGKGNSDVKRTFVGNQKPILFIYDFNVRIYYLI